MRKVTLFIAMSVDGFIATENGDVNWLTGEQSGQNDTQSYDEFIKEVDTVVMGYKTYHQLKTELSPNEWPYANCQTYVITSKHLANESNIIFTSKDPSSLVSELRQKQGKTIWICGGSQVIQPLIADGLIDEYYLNVIPTILGSGIRLFNRKFAKQDLHLVSSKSYNGIIDLIYRRR